MNPAPPGGTRLAGKTALVTGAGSGIGRRITQVFAAQGASVVAADVDKEAVEGLVHELQEGGGDARAVSFDVTSMEATGLAVREGVEWHGSIDVLVANAGISADGRAHEIDEATWSKAIAVNLTGTWHTMRAVLPHMMRQRRGVILSTASLTAIAGTPNTAVYSATKGGIVALTRQIATEYAPHGVRANSICPGSVMTPLWLEAYEARGEVHRDDPDGGIARVSRRYPLGRIGTVDDVAYLALYLASDEASWVTGLALPLDGGASSTAWQA